MLLLYVGELIRGSVPDELLLRVSLGMRSALVIVLTCVLPVSRRVTSRSSLVPLRNKLVYVVLLAERASNLMVAVVGPVAGRCATGWRNYRLRSADNGKGKENDSGH